MHTSKPQSVFGTVINSNTIVLAAGGILAYALYSKGRALTTLNFYPASVRDISFDGVTPVMKIGIAIQNTSGQNMVLRSFAGNVYANGYLIGNVSNFIPVAIRPNGQTLLTVNTRLSILGIVQDIIAAFRGEGIRQTFELDARANVDNYQLPIKIKYSV